MYYQMHSPFFEHRDIFHPTTSATIAVQSNINELMVFRLFIIDTASISNTM